MAERRKRAAALVYRRVAGKVQYLLVTAQSDPSWLVMPQGGIEAGELPAEAARRETLEEAGAAVVVERELGSFEHEHRDRQNHTTVFLAAFVSQHPSPEGRTVQWVTWDELKQWRVPAQTLDYITAVHFALESA